MYGDQMEKDTILAVVSSRPAVNVAAVNTAADGTATADDATTTDDGTTADDATTTEDDTTIPTEDNIKKVVVPLVPPPVDIF